MDLRSTARAAAPSLVLCAVLAPSLATAVAQQAAAPASLLRRETDVEYEVPSAPGGMLRLTCGPRGGVQVAVWRERKIRVEAHVEIDAPTERDLDLLAKVVAVTVDPAPTGVDVETRGPHDREWMRNVKKFPDALARMPWRVDYVVWVPEFTSLDVRVVDGETLVEGVSGAIGVTSMRGLVRLERVSGTVHVNALDGDVAIAAHERSWRGGNLRASTAGGSIRMAVPQGFSASLDAHASGGVSIEVVGEEPRRLGPEVRETLGAGGAAVTLAASGTITISVVPQR